MVIQNNQESDGTFEALQWYLDHGVDEVMGDDPIDRTVQDHVMPPHSAVAAQVHPTARQRNASHEIVAQPVAPVTKVSTSDLSALLSDVHSLDALKEVIAGYDEIGLKKTATNMVFADGNPKAHVMVVGETPGADEDRQGKPFVGVSGQFLDKILACIDLSRSAEKTENAVYISNIINWRPPGNRTPSPIEIEQSLPFIEKHIALVNPDFLIFAGGVAAKTLLHSKDSISKLRGKFHDYLPHSLEGQKPIKAIATYHPAYLLRTPTQKRAVWQDMLMLQEALQKT